MRQSALNVRIIASELAIWKNALVPAVLAQSCVKKCPIERLNILHLYLDMKTAFSLVAMVLALALGGAAQASEQTDPMVQKLNTVEASQFDGLFLRSMIAHHQGGIMMANIALKKAVHPELKRFASEMIAKQKKEIGEMSVWLKEWSQTVPEDSAQSEASRKKTHQDMEELEMLSANDFDLTFAKMMAKHHQSAIGMAKLVEQKSRQSQLKQFAEKLIADQSMEVTQLRKWQKEWSVEK